MAHKFKAHIDDDRRIVVELQILDKKKVVREMNLAFPADATPKEILKEVERQDALYFEEMENKEEQKKLDKEMDTAQKTVEKLNKS